MDVDLATAISALRHRGNANSGTLPVTARLSRSNNGVASLA